MWKLMICGVLVQMVLLVSILDTNVYDDADGQMRYFEKRACIRNVMVVVVEGLEFDDILLAMNHSDIANEMILRSSTYRVVSSNETDFVPPPASSIFDDKQVLYVGPPASPYQFNTSLWDFICINEEDSNITSYFLSAEEVAQKNANGSYQPRINRTITLLNDSIIEDIMSYGSYMVNSEIVVDHMKKIIDTQQLDFYPVKFINFGPKSGDFGPLSPDERSWYVSQVYEVIMNSSRSSSYVFIIASSISMMVHNSSTDLPGSLLIYGHPECFELPIPTFFNETLTYEQAFEKMDVIVTLSAVKKEVNHLKDPMVNYFTVEGNLLDFLGFRVFEMQKLYKSFGLCFTGWESIDAVFHSLEYIDTETHPIVLTMTLMTFLLWTSYLAIKALKMVLEIPNDDQVNLTVLKLLNAFCLLMILIIFVAIKCSGYPFRYLIYFGTVLLIFRLLCGEILSSMRINIDCSLMDRVNIIFQALILVGVVESFYWSIFHKNIIVVLFFAAASARILQAAFSVINFKIIIAFSSSTILVGLMYIWPIMPLGNIANMNLSAAAWAVGGGLATVFLMRNANADRLLMLTCLVELMFAAIIADIMIISGVSFSFIIPTVFFFTSLSMVLPLFGGSDPKHRLLELAVATASVYLFFSWNGEGLFLGAAFAASFCSYMMDRATTKKLSDDSYYFNVFPLLFHTALLILACHVIAPSGGEAILGAYTLISPDSSYYFAACGILYFLKVAFLVNLLQATFLSTGKKLLEFPNLFLIVVMLNLISLRAFIPHSIFSYEVGRREVFLHQILFHVLAALSFYLFSFFQALCSTNLCNICQSLKTYIPRETVN